MPACEKCWGDAYGFGDQAEKYRELLKQRAAEGRVCTPEQQAGPDATDCPKCKRRTLHQHCRICMNCGYNTEQVGHI